MRLIDEHALVIAGKGTVIDGELYIKVDDLNKCLDKAEVVQPQGIDKDRLIEILLNHYLVNDKKSWNEAIDWFVEVVKSQPTSDGWIPVSERLPKPYEEVIFCNNIISCYGSIDSDGVWWASDVIPFKQFMKAYNVKAWRPLPQPYKESE